MRRGGDLGRLLGVLLLAVLTGVGVAGADDPTEEMADLSFRRDNFWPIQDQRQDIIEETRETSVLGPLFFHKRKGPERSFGLRPFFYYEEDTDKDTVDLDILYPLFSYHRVGDEPRYRVLWGLPSADKDVATTGETERRFSIVPFYYSRQSETRPSYRAVFPVWGTIREAYGFDTISWRFFPGYARLEKAGLTNEYYLFPFFARYSGNQQGFRFWPLYGRRYQEGGFDKTFVLWPLYIRDRPSGTEENPRDFLISFPFYGRMRSPQIDVDSFLLLGARIENRKEGYTEWGFPWPLWMVARGENRNITRFVPLFGVSQVKDERSRFVLWPLYRYRASEDEDFYDTQTRLLLWVFTDRREGRRRFALESRRVALWPFFTYTRERDGSRRLNGLSVLAPIFPAVDGFERNYEPLWRIYSYRRDPRGRVVHSLLWNLVRTERSDEHRVVEFLGPLFSYQAQEADGGWRFEMFKGFFSVGARNGRSLLKFLYIPIRRGG